MPAGMFSIDSILSGRPSCKEPLLLHRSGPVVLSAGLTDSIYTDYSGLYTATCGPSAPGVQPVNGTRIGYNGYYYGQLHVQGAGGGPPCCGSVPGLGPQQCPCIPAGRTVCTDLAAKPRRELTWRRATLARLTRTCRWWVCQCLDAPLCSVMVPSLRFAGYDSPSSVLISPVPHQMMSYMNMGSLSRTELQLLNQLHCRRKRRHRTIFTDEQLEALEGLFQETKYPDVGTREQLARKVHLREEKVEVSGAWFCSRTLQLLLLLLELA